LEKILLRGGYIVSMDPSIGDVRGGDILIDGDRIAAVGRSIAVEDAKTIDATGMIVMPGMVDGHKHTWQTLFRSTCGDETLSEFFGEAVPSTAPLMEPEDVYAANLLGAVDALDGGVTTFVDWCHITITPDHARAAITALVDSGARAWYGYGRSLLTWSDRSLDHPADIRDVRRDVLASDRGLVRLAMAARGPMFADLEPTRRDFHLAREIGVPISLHVDMPGYAGNDLVNLDEMGVLGPDVALLHGNTMTDHEIDLAVAAGCRFVDSSPLDTLMGIGAPVTERLLRKGIEPGISPDSVVANPTDLFWVMRALILLERARAYAPVFAADRQPDSAHLDARTLLTMATLRGAEAVWLGDEIGSLTPGKKADAILLRTSDLNLQPLNDVATTIVFSAGPGNVDTVILDGRIVKQGGHMVGIDLDRVRRLAAASRDRIYEAAERNGYVPTWRSAGLA
jgi:5-methylthioadenosine/S-adenosylhomocysteine deaminase